MDDTFIKMCDCPEIQGQWKPAVGDWFYKEDGIGFGLWLVSDIQEYGEKPYLDTVLYCSGKRMHNPPFGLGLVEFREPESYIWLPTQDQLQAMLEGGWIDILEKFTNYIGGSSFDYIDDEVTYWETYKTNATSMEQLWLSFVMFERYKKIWSGTNWELEVGGKGGRYD